MKVILERLDTTLSIRHHPYDGAGYDSRVKHYDFVKHPDLIRQVLEDFKPWEKYEAVERFYQLLEWINSANSILESSDCRLEKPKNIVYQNGKKGVILQGRLMIFFREAQLNFRELTSKNSFLVSACLRELIMGCYEFLERQFRETAPAVVLQLMFFPSFYIEQQQYGHQLVFQFKCFGENKAGLFASFASAIEVILETLKQQIESSAFERP